MFGWKNIFSFPFL